MAPSAKSDRNLKISETHEYNILIETRELFLVDHDDGLHPQDAMAFLKNVRILLSVNKDPIIIHQHSFGGDWSAGMMIYDTIMSLHKVAPVLFICYGCAGSMGSIIPQAAFRNGLRLCYANCEFLIHEGSTDLHGTHKFVQAQAKREKEQAEIMYDIYAESCANGELVASNTLEQTKNLIKRKVRTKEDWILDADQAVDYGFVDGVLGSEEFPSIEVAKKKLNDYVF